MDKDTFTLRIPVETNNKIKALSNEIGVSQNAIVLMFINLGLNSFDDIIHLQKEGFRRYLLESQQ